MRLYKQKNDLVNFSREALALMKTALENDNISVISDTLDYTKTVLGETAIDDYTIFQLACFYKKTDRWNEALQAYRRIADKPAKSAFYPKTLFSIGRILKYKLSRPDEADKYFQKLLDPPFDIEWAEAAKKELII